MKDSLPRKIVLALFRSPHASIRKPFWHKYIQRRHLRDCLQPLDINCITFPYQRTPPARVWHLYLVWRATSVTLLWNHTNLTSTWGEAVYPVYHCRIKTRKVERSLGTIRGCCRLHMWLHPFWPYKSAVNDFVRYCLLHTLSMCAQCAIFLARHTFEK